jgi:hypothetical protein
MKIPTATPMFITANDANRDADQRAGAAHRGPATWVDVSALERDRYFSTKATVDATAKSNETRSDRGVPSK